MSEWKYNLRWRTNFEGLETLGWTAGIAATIGVNTLFNMPSLPCYLSVAVQAALVFVVSRQHGIFIRTNAA